MIIAVDGNALFCRQYFAPGKDLTSPDGIPTKATYGFFRALLWLQYSMMTEKDRMLVCFDSPKKHLIKRNIEPTYKAGRVAKGRAFGVELKQTKRLLGLCGVPVWLIPGYEADDLLFSVTRQRPDKCILIISHDKDLECLVEESERRWVRILSDTGKSTTIRTAKDVEKQRGFPPEQLLALQALMGDSTDNIKGVEGIGPKTAAALLRMHHSLKGVLRAVRSRSCNLSSHLLRDPDKLEKQLELSRYLVTPVAAPDPMPTLTTLPPQLLTRESRAAFRELGFKV